VNERNRVEPSIQVQNTDLGNANAEDLLANEPVAEDNAGENISRTSSSEESDESRKEGSVNSKDNMLAI